MLPRQDPLCTSPDEESGLLVHNAPEVKGEEHAIPVRGVVGQFVRWFLGGTFPTEK